MTAIYISMAGLAISAISVTFAFYFNRKSSVRTDVKDIEERVRANTEINYKLDSIQKTTQEIKEEVSDLKKVVQMHGEDIVSLKASYKAEHKRLDEIAQRINIPRNDRED